MHVSGHSTVARLTGLALAALLALGLTMALQAAAPSAAHGKSAVASGGCSPQAKRLMRRLAKSKKRRARQARSCSAPTTTTTDSTSTTTSTPPPSSSQTSSGSGGGSYTPPTTPPANPNCPLAQAGSTIGMSLPDSCTVVASDTASNPDPTGFWGKIDCQASSRHQQITSGGDSHQMGEGGSQNNSSFRRMTVLDGDNVYGKRCELGHNNMNAPTAFYHEGERRVTYASIRMPSNSSVSSSAWRNVFQMKQAQPYNNPNMASIFEMQVHHGRWWVQSNWVGTWDAPAQQNTWTRFAFDITYSQNPALGSIKVYVDLNTDGDFSDSGEQSPRFPMQTLQVETAPAADGGVGAGQSIPSHLRAGIYEDESYSCPPPNGCSVDVDNVQVIRA